MCYNERLNGTYIILKCECRSRSIHPFKLFPFIFPFSAFCLSSHFAHTICCEVCCPGNRFFALRTHTETELNWIMVIASLRWSLLSHSSSFSHPTRYEDTYWYTSHMECVQHVRSTALNIALNLCWVDASSWYGFDSKHQRKSTKNAIQLATCFTYGHIERETKRGRKTKRQKLTNTESSECIFLWRME